MNLILTYPEAWQTRDGAENKKCIRLLRCVRKSCPHAAPHRIQTQLSLCYTAPQVIYSLNFHKHQKKFSSLVYNIQKIDFGGNILDGFQKGGRFKRFVFLNICW